MMMTSETSADKLAFVTGIGEIGGYAERAAQEAVREAERVLAEAEPEQMYTALIHIERIQGAGRTDNRGRVAGYVGTVALAESLTAVLPVLDELAEDSLGMVYIGANAWSDAEAHYAMVARNRATLAGMEAGR